MPNRNQIRGALLEEACIYLLRQTGFKIVDDDPSDPTVTTGHNGLQIKGRGERHQADALGQFLIPMPFGHPERLIVEAKFRSSRSVGIDVVRNAVGVLKDVDEYFLPDRGGKTTERRRYHYRYAVFSATSFSRPAVRYAFAQDIYLIQLGQNLAMQPVLRAIDRLSGVLFEDENRGEGISLIDMRRLIREKLEELAPGRSVQQLSINTPDDWAPLLDRLSNVGASFIGIANEQFMLHLVPRSFDVFETIVDVASDGPISVSIHPPTDSHSERGWTMRLLDVEGSDDGESLELYFDVPEDLFLQYADSGILSATQTLRLKSNFEHIDCVVTQGDDLHLVRFTIGRDWYEGVARQLRETRT